MQISANGIRIEVEEHGSRQGEPLLLIMGLGMQLVAWQPGFVERLVRAGFRVLRFDNRDIGLSENLDRLGLPNIGVAGLRSALGLSVRSPYRLADMALDSAGVLDAFDIERAHVCGASMGGMIAQHLAARHADRVKSLTLVMTSSGARRLPGPSMKVRSAMLSGPRVATDLDAVVAHYVKRVRLIGSPGYPLDEAALVERLGHSIRRAFRPQGTARQMVAIAADGDRSPLLRGLRTPTHVVHGLGDPLIPPAAARDLAAKIPGASLELIDGMGHDMPAALWPRLVESIVAVAQRGEPGFRPRRSA